MKIDNKNYLLQLARKAIERYSDNHSILQIDDGDLDDEIKVKRATFITLTKNNELRGCMGELQPKEKLYQSIINNSLASAFLDPRFYPIAKDEIDDIKIEISILSPVKKSPSFKHQQELLTYLDNNKPGILIEKNGHQATFLPQVWLELPNPADFLSQLCLKAGLAENQWQNLDINISEYQVEHFKEK